MYPPMPPRIKETPHVLNLFATIVTAGMWAPVWLLIAVTNKLSNDRKQQKYAEDLMRYRIWEREFDHNLNQGNF